MRLLSFPQKKKAKNSAFKDTYMQRVGSALLFDIIAGADAT